MTNLQGRRGNPAALQVFWPRPGLTEMSDVSATMCAMDIQTLTIILAIAAATAVIVTVLRSQQRPTDNAAAINQAVAAGLRHLIEANEQQRTATTTAMSEQLTTVRTALDDLKRESRDWDQKRAEAIGALRTVTESTKDQVERLNQETASLSGAMRGNQTRGKWGEVSLRNVIESVGMLEHVDFIEQVQQEGAGTGRPDVTVKIPGGRVMYIDAKVPWAAYQESLGESDPVKREELLKKNAKAIRGHVDALAAREYRSSLQAMSHVVMFVPIESALSSALVFDPDLISYATAKGVVLTSVASLIVILSNFRQGWVLEAKIDNVDKIANASDELIKRLMVLIGHFDKIGDGIRKAGQAYNDAVGSYTGRIAPQIREVDLLLATKRESRDIDPVEFEPRTLPTAAKDSPRSPVEEIRLPDPDQPSGG